jgi:hypothetical protein
MISEIEPCGSCGGVSASNHMIPDLAINHNNQAKTFEDASSPLDLFSIRETDAFPVNSYAPDLELLCINRAPYFAYQVGLGKGYAIAQGNCHDWKCPKCGLGRAKQEYGRIVEGCRTLAKDYKLYFMTITCKGREISWEQSEAGYYQWTHRLITTLRKSAKKYELHWAYVQVTERQKRGHPHSHFLTTYHPHDLLDGFKESWKNVGGKLVCEQLPALRSEYLLARVTSAGLGSQYDISEVQSAEAASRYVAKYMFKESMFLTDWPKKWHRVRYSRSFPKLEEKTSDAMVLIKRSDWRELARKAVVVLPQSKAAQAEAEYWFSKSDVIIRKVK